MLLGKRSEVEHFYAFLLYVGRLLDRQVASLLCDVICHYWRNAHYIEQGSRQLNILSSAGWKCALNLSYPVGELPYVVLEPSPRNFADWIMVYHLRTRRRKGIANTEISHIP